jgi:hypothetical protein
MARILFGGPQQEEGAKPEREHQDLVSRLKQEGHEVDYITKGDDMLELLIPHPWRNSINYDLVIYDTGLLYGKASPKKRAVLFNKKVIEYLIISSAPVIVLSEPEISKYIKGPVQKAGFIQITQPYNIEDVLKQVR